MQPTNCRLGIKHVPKYKIAISCKVIMVHKGKVFSHHKCHTCYHFKMASNLEVRAAIVSYTLIILLFSHSFDFQDSKIVTVKCLTVCYMYLHGEAIKKFKLHNYVSKIAFIVLLFTTPCGVMLQNILSLNLYRYT